MHTSDPTAMEVPPGRRAEQSRSSARAAAESPPSEGAAAGDAARAIVGAIALSPASESETGLRALGAPATLSEPRGAARGAARDAAL
jgi:hypothetical protein